MKAAIFHPGQIITVKDVEKSIVGKKEVLLAVRACAICGSDIENYRDGGIEHPSTWGHEVAGEVLSVGKEVIRIKEGDRIAVYALRTCRECRQCQSEMTSYCTNIKGVIGTPKWPGGFAEYVVIPEDNCLLLPDWLSWKESAMITDCIGTPLAAIRQADLSTVYTALVIGCGPIGLNAIQVLKGMGIQVFASGVRSYRREKALELGADYVFDPNLHKIAGEIKARTEGGVDLTIETSGNNKGRWDGTQSTRPAGQMVFLASAPFQLPGGFILKCLRMYGAQYFPINIYSEHLRLVQSNRVKLEPLVSHSFKLEEIKTAFELGVSKQDKVLKIIIHP